MLLNRIIVFGLTMSIIYIHAVLVCIMVWWYNWFVFKKMRLQYLLQVDDNRFDFAGQWCYVGVIEPQLCQNIIENVNKTVKISGIARSDYLSEFMFCI